MRDFFAKTLTIGSLVFFVTFGASALAINSMANERFTQAQENAKIRLEGAKLKACQTREQVIKSMMERIAQRGERRMNVYNTIVERVKAFYDKKGLSLSNYNDLLADVEAKKSAAAAALDEIKSTSVKFACDGTDPKGVASSFRDSLKAEIAALKAYQKSIKDLIVAVKTSIKDSAPNNNSNGAGDQ
jgi:hypothetical protein